MSPKPQQKPVELDMMLRMLRNHPPRTVLEIGVCEAGTLNEWARVTQKGGKVIGVDLDIIPAKVASVSEVEILLYGGNSASQAVSERVRKSGPFDFIFIDGDHSYEGVRADWNCYAADEGMARAGTIIALHDIVPHTEFPNVGVHRAWEQIKNIPGVDYTEFIQETIPAWGGIGVVTVSPQAAGEALRIP